MFQKKKLCRLFNGSIYLKIDRILIILCATTSITTPNLFSWMKYTRYVHSYGELRNRYKIWPSEMDTLTSMDTLTLHRLEEQSNFWVYSFCIRIFFFSYATLFFSFFVDDNIFWRKNNLFYFFFIDNTRSTYSLFRIESCILYAYDVLFFCPQCTKIQCQKSCALINRYYKYLSTVFVDIEARLILLL